MFFKKMIVFTMCLSLSGIFSTTLVIAGEAQKIPLTRDELSVLQQLGGNEIQTLVREKFVGTSMVKDASTNLSDKQRQALLSVTPEQLDLIIAGEMEGSDLLVAALAAFGIFFIVLIIAAS